MTLLQRIADWLDSIPRVYGVLIGVALWTVAYAVPGYLHFREPVPWPITFVDRLIPVVAFTIVIYLSVFIQILWAIWGLKPGVFGRAYLAGAFVLVLHALFFFFFPSVYPREGLPVSESWRWLYELMWRVDPPQNCFPSLHVSIAFLAAYAYTHQNTRKGALFFAWACLIALSTLTTRQHYMLDIMTGGAVAAAAYLLVFRLLSPEGRKGLAAGG